MGSLLMIARRHKPGILGLAAACMLVAVTGTNLGAVAQETNAPVDQFPLQLSHNSSPRDTLRTFLANVKIVVEAWRLERQNDISDRAWISAQSALDFTATPDSDSWAVRTERVMLLTEILDRVELPPDSKIPGEEEVQRENLTRWTIPNTGLTISKAESGPQEGQFLFSAGSVERLFRSYQLVKDLTCKRSAIAPGIYNAILNSTNRTLITFERRLRDRLRGVDASCPRSTLQAFLWNVDRAYKLVMDADEALKAKPPTMTKQQARAVEKMANEHLRRAQATLDLSRIPEAHRKAAGLEAVFKLKEVLDRTVLPELDSIPDLTAVSAAGEQASRSTGNAGARSIRWRYPNTEIEITEIIEGNRRGEFLFSANTVGQISDIYERARSLPYRAELSRAPQSKYMWSDVSEGFFDYFVSNPGHLVARATFLGRLVDGLPKWAKIVHGGLSLWQWFGLLLSAAGSVLVAMGALRVIKRLADRAITPLNGWVMFLAPLVLLLILATAAYVAELLNVTGWVRVTITTGMKATAIILVIWGVVRLFKAIAESIIASPKIRDRSLDASLLRITMRIAAFLIGAWIFIYSLRDLGADLFPLLAGLGVGGLAVALAAQRTLANFIGSLILFANKPVKPGDFCRYGDQIGTVEHIGLLSTRIRSLERTLVTVPNAELSEIKLENYAMRDQRLLKTVLQLRYETTPEQLRCVLARLRELLLSHPKVLPDPARVRLIGYGNFSKDVEVFAYLDCQDQNTFLAIQEDVLLRMEEIIVQAGSGFAFPSQTTYLSRDSGLDRERARQAEAWTQRSRETGTLPFPEFAPQQRERLAGTLEYPPPGSPDHVAAIVARNTTTAAPSAAFTAADIGDLRALARRLREPRQIADFVWSRLSTRTQKLLTAAPPEEETKLRQLLADDLNDLIQGPLIYAVDRFSDVKRRPETQALLDSNPEGIELGRLNRMLLEDAFPEQLGRGSKAPATK